MILFIGSSVEDRLSKEEKKLIEKEEQGFEMAEAILSLIIIFLIILVLNKITGRE